MDSIIKLTNCDISNDLQCNLPLTCSTSLILLLHSLQEVFGSNYRMTTV